MAEKATIVLSGGKFFCPAHPLHLQEVNIWLDKGIIREISSEPIDPSGVGQQNINGKYVSMGLVDCIANFCDPGLEHKEDLTSGAWSSCSGGFTHSAVSPFTDPIADSKSGISYIKYRNESSPITLLPLGSISENGANEHITEMFDMVSAGAIGFYSGKKQLNEKLLITALRYSTNTNSRIFIYPIIDRLAENGQVNESVVSTKTGLKGIPNLAESLAIKNIINILEYCGGSVHISHVSTKEGVAQIKQAKEAGLNITCGVAAHQLLFTDDAVLSFDSRFKVQPPLRSKSDQQAIIEGCKDGTIDCIFSDHEPVDIENKKVEFDYAEFGIVSNQTMLTALYDKLKDQLGFEKLVTLCCYNPRSMFGLPTQILKDQSADLVIFDPEQAVSFSEAELKSKSKNSPFLKQSFQGKVDFTIGKGIMHDWT